MKALTWRRVAPGHYEARIGTGTLDRYDIESVGRDDRDPDGTLWMLTYRDGSRPDDAFWTLRDAKAAAEAHRWEARASAAN